MRGLLLTGLLVATVTTTGCVADTEEEPEELESTESSPLRKNQVCPDDSAANEVCVGNSNLAGGRSDWSVKKRTSVVKSFLKYVNGANLTVVSVQETNIDHVPELAHDLAASKGPWRLASAAGCGRVMYRSDRVTVARVAQAAPVLVPNDAGVSSVNACAVIVTTLGGASPFLFVGGGFSGTDGKAYPLKDTKAPAKRPSTWLLDWVADASKANGGLPIVMAFDMNGNAPEDKDRLSWETTKGEPLRWHAIHGAGFRDAGQRNTVANGNSTTLDYVWMKGKGAKHEGHQSKISGGSDHMWIWSKVSL